MYTHIETILQSIEKNYIGTDNPYWNISREVGIFLNSLICATQATRVLEVGTSIGYSTLFLAEPFFIDGGGEVITVESHDERFSLAHKHFDEARVGHIVTQIHGHAPEVLHDLQGMFDMVFFDATKYEHVSYIEAIEKKLSQRALVIADNVLSHPEEMTPYVTYMTQHPSFQTSVIPLGTGLCMSLKLPNN